GPGRGPRPGLRHRPTLPGAHGQPVRPAAQRRPLLLPQRELHAAGDVQTPAGQHAGQGDRGQHGVTNLQSDVFLFKASIGGRAVFAPDGDLGPADQFGVPGVTVQLQDNGGDVLATTLTDLFGNYSFSQLGGPAATVDVTPGVSATGYYNVVILLPPWLQQTTA